MNDDTIKSKLDALDELQNQLTSMRLRHDEQLIELMGPEIAALVNEARASFEAQSAMLSAEIQGATEAVKALVLAAGTTVKGQRLQAVWQKGRVTWDTKGLDGYALAHPEVSLMFRKEGEPTVSIRGVR